MKSSLLERIRGLLVHPRLPVWVGVLAFLLTLPAVKFGFLVDDQLHAYYLRGGEVPGGPRGMWDLYRFADGGAGTARAIETGQYPWWTSHALRFGFLRPLSSLWVTLDHLVLGPFIGHLASCVAYGLLAYVVAKIFKRITPGAAAGVAAFLFAVDDSHNFTVLWIANRHALTSALFGSTALLLHLRRREDGRGPAWLPAVLLGLAFAAGESALAVLPYFIAYAWWLDPGGRRKGLAALAPCGVATLLWAAAFVAGGYGTAGSALYIDPIGQPGAFAKSIVERLPVLLFSQLWGVPADIFPLLPPEAFPKVLGIACLLLAGLGYVLYRLTRHHRAAAPLAFGTVLTLVPCCATFPSDRLLLLAGIGAFALIGIAVARVGRDVAAGTARLSGRAFVAFAFLIHVVVALPLLPMRTMLTGRVFSESIQRGAASLPSDEAIRDQRLVIISAPDALMCTYMFLERAVSGLPAARSARLLAVSQRGSVTIRRENEHDFELRADAPINADVFSLLYRPDRYRAGEIYDSGSLVVTVLEVDSEGWPRALRAHFDEVSAEKQRWIAWRHHGFVEEPILAVGETRVIPTTPWDEAMGM